MAESRREGILRKLKALADRGVGGEKTNAEALLKAMMEKYGVTEEELSGEEREYRDFRYKGAFGHKLMSQIIVMVMGRDVCLYRWKNTRGHIIVVKCTKAEQMEIEAAYSFYRRQLDLGLERFYAAFVQVEELFPEDSEAQEPNGDTDWEMIELAASLRKHSRLLEIEGG